MTRAAVVTLAIPMLVVGGIFTGQGFGYIGGSFMTGSGFWAVVGLILIAAAAGLIFVGARFGGRS